MIRLFKTVGYLFIVTLMLLYTPEGRAATKSAPDSLVYSFHFRQGDDMLLGDYKNNRQHLTAMARWMTAENIARISSIKIIGAASPEGTIEFNDELSLKRAQAVRNYINWRWKINRQQAIVVSAQNDYVSAWLRAVENDPNVPRKDAVLKILRSNSSVQTKWANIQLLAGGAAQYIEIYIFPPLRNALACVITLKDSKIATLQDAPKSVAPIPVISIDTIASGTAANDGTVANDGTAANISNVANTGTVTNNGAQLNYDNPAVASPKMLKPNKPLFALKTNLLFDAATILNFEAEVPIGNRWSIAGEIIFPWWLWEDKQNCIQVLSGTIEARYWFGNRKKRDVMTGWFAGIHMGGGYYDLEWNHKGYQGEFFLASGVTGGYTHAINKKGTLRMEYSLGVGYLSTSYRHYEARFVDSDNSWHLYRQDNGQFSWLGPTRAKISLVWLLDTNLFKKKGGRK